MGTARTPAQSGEADAPQPALARLLGNVGPGAAVQLGERLLGAGRASEAQTLFQQLVLLKPDHAAARAGLGMAMMAAGSTEAALATLAEALQLDPARINTAAQVLYAHESAGRADAAAALLRDAVTRWPDLTHLRIACSQALRSVGQIREALEELLIAARLAPRSAEVWRTLAAVQLTFPNMAANAVRSAEKFVELAPGVRSRSLLSEALYAAGRHADARAQLLVTLPFETWNSAFVTPAARPSAGSGLRVAVLTTLGVVHTPLRFLFDQFGKTIDWIPVLDDVRYPAAAIGRSYDVLVNAVADADLAPAALRQAGDLVAEAGVPVVNRPDVILETTRDSMARRLAGVPGLLVPRTARVTREVLQSPGGGGVAEAVGFPLLVRSIGSHGGDDIRKVGDEIRLADAVAESDAAEFYLTEFVDFSSPDGFYRKFRVAFVGGTAYPYHLSISPGWLNHYFRSRMGENELFRKEEERFLLSPDSHLGEVATLALKAIAARVPLDYVGVDFALHRDGRVILFECNAVMLIATPQTEAFRYRHEAAARIRRAFAAVLRERALSR